MLEGWSKAQKTWTRV